VDNISVDMITGVSDENNGGFVGAAAKVTLGAGETVAEGVGDNIVLVGEGVDVIVIVELMVSLAVILGEGDWLACCITRKSILTPERPPLLNIRLFAVIGSLARFMHNPRISHASIDGSNKPRKISRCCNKITGSFADAMMKIISTLPTENAICDICRIFPTNTEQKAKAGEPRRIERVQIS
jgi:hypothetical protein